MTNLLLLSGDLAHQTVVRARKTAAGPHDGYYTMFVVYPPKSGLLTAVDGAVRAAQRPGILEFKVATPPLRLERDTEEEYLAKYWGRVPSREAVLQLYQGVVADLNPSVLAKASQIITTKDHDLEAISAEFDRAGFVHLPDFGSLIPGAEGRKASFNAYWDELVLDENFRSYTTRHRRILRYWYRHPGQFELNGNRIYQAKATYAIDYTRGANHLTYATPQFIADGLMQAILRVDLEILRPALIYERTYSIDIDLFRVSARDGERSPTTSGRHQDGEDFLCMHFIGADNTQPVVSEILPAEPQGSPLLRCAMGAFLETLAVNDRRLFHAAGPVVQICPSRPAHRNLLVVSISARPEMRET